MARQKTRYECGNCGHTSAKWLGQCPSCSQWHTFEEYLQPEESGRRHKIESALEDRPRKPLRLSDIDSKGISRVRTGLNEFDRVLGGGLVPASLILLGGDPGIGKSTLMLQIAGSNPELKILYIAGEESAGQIRQRADRLAIRDSELKLLDVTDLDKVISHVRNEPPELLVIDSIQTVYRSQLAGLPGSVQQLRECAAVLQQLAKREGVTTLMIGHVTKDGEIAGPRILEHMVDTVLQFEGDLNRIHRLLRSVKNRFGPSQEVGVFEMGENGLREVDNPSALFLSDMDHSVSGNVVSSVMEGSRPILVEIQALVTPGNYGTPQRTASGFDQRRLSLLLAVLEKRAGFEFSSRDVYLNVAGGIRVTDTAVDLAVVSALASSYRERALPEKTVVIGELGLGGEIRLVPQMGKRLEEASKMGFSRAVTPVLSSAVSVDDGLEVAGSRYLGEALAQLLRDG